LHEFGISEKQQSSVFASLGHHSYGSAPAHTDSMNPRPTPGVKSIVFVVDDDVSVRESLELLIENAGWQPELFASAQEFLSRPRAAVPSCLVLDVHLPGLDGLELQRQLTDRNCVPIVFITGHGDVPTTVRAMKAGAVEFLTKPLEDDGLLRAIGDAIERSRAALRREFELYPLRKRYQALTPRERQVMALVVSGRLNKQIAGQLGLSEITVKMHRGRVMRKMQARSVPSLVMMADRLGVPREPVSQAIIKRNSVPIP
jgi:FixJ family two-component response regulator